MNVLPDGNSLYIKMQVIVEKSQYIRSCFAVCCIVTALLSLNLYIFNPKRTDDDILKEAISLQIKNRLDIQVAIVACGNRFEEALTNIKSALLFSKETFFLHLFAENNLHQRFKNSFEKWPVSYRQRLKYTLYQITYPDGRSKLWKKLFKPCSSQRLFFPTILNGHVDSLIYVDADVLFLSDIRGFWNLFQKFNSTQILAMGRDYESEKNSWYNEDYELPFYGKTGVNTGVMLMNLTRIRSAKFKNNTGNRNMSWKDMLLPLYNKYRDRLRLADQDILNIMFHYNPEMLHVSSCEWNYRSCHCENGEQLCDPVRENGVKIMHGNNEVYLNDIKPSFKAVYEAIKEYSLQDDLKNLLEALKSKLKDTENSYCGKEQKHIWKGIQRSIENTF